MWRAFFLAMGIASIILGAECLAIEKAILAPTAAAAPNGNSTPLSAPVATKREVNPPEWAPWSLLSAGAVVVLYSFTLPKRVAS